MQLRHSASYHPDAHAIAFQNGDERALSYFFNEFYSEVELLSLLDKIVILFFRMQELIRYWPSAIILLAGIAASIGTFISNKQDSKQKDRIERFGRFPAESACKF